MRRRAGAASLAWVAAGLALAACDANPAHVREAGRRRELAGLGVTGLDGRSGYSLAGMSTYREIEIDGLEPRDEAALASDPAFHAYSMRCGSCHRVPAPATKPAYLWDAVRSRMRKNAADAGLLPLDSAEDADIGRFLREHAAR